MGWWKRAAAADAEPPGPAVGSGLRPSSPAKGGPPEKLTSLTFDRFLSEYPRAVVDVWAPWCAPCRQFAPIFDRASRAWGDRVGFGKLHADHEPTLVRRLTVRSLPSLLFFRQGKVVRREVGLVSSDRLAAQLRLAFRDVFP